MKKCLCQQHIGLIEAAAIRGCLVSITSVKHACTHSHVRTYTRTYIHTYQFIYLLTSVRQLWYDCCNYKTESTLLGSKSYRYFPEKHHTAMSQGPYVSECNETVRQPHDTQVVVWRSGSALVSINQVNLRRARLVLGWVTMSGFNSRWRTFISVCNQPPRPTQCFIASAGSVNEDQLRLGRKRQVWFIPLSPSLWTC